MPSTNAALNFKSVNVSAQVGDIIYYTSIPAPTGSFNQGVLSGTSMLGPILGIALQGDGTTNITVEYDSDLHPSRENGNLDLSDEFFSFAKDKRVNTTSLLGYYASVNFVNDSTGKIELFSVGSEVSESSK
jgi:hypothetical protein